jgi:hypothetical protein
VRSLRDWYATVTFRLLAGTAWRTAKCYKVFPIRVKYRSIKQNQLTFIIRGAENDVPVAMRSGLWVTHWIFLLNNKQRLWVLGSVTKTFRENSFCICKSKTHCHQNSDCGHLQYIHLLPSLEILSETVFRSFVLMLLWMSSSDPLNSVFYFPKPATSHRFQNV